MMFGIGTNVRGGARVRLVSGVLLAVAVAASGSVTSAASATPTITGWSGRTTLAVGYQPEVSASSTPDGRAVAFFGSATSAARTRAWSLAFRVQHGNGWSPLRTVVKSAPTTGQLIYAEAASDDRIVMVIGIVPAPGRVPLLTVREVTSTGQLILSRRLGYGSDPDIAIDKADRVAIVMHGRTGGTVFVGGWTVSRAGTVTPGTLVASPGSGPIPNTYGQPKVVAIGTGLFGVVYQDGTYQPGFPHNQSVTVDQGAIAANDWSRGGVVTSGDDVIQSLALVSRGTTMFLAASNQLNPDTGLSELLTTTSDPFSWTATQKLSTYRTPAPRLDRNVAFSAKGDLVAVVTNRAYLSDGGGEGEWVASSRVPAATGRCGANTSATFGAGSLHWFAAVPSSGGHCALADYRLRTVRQ